MKKGPTAKRYDEATKREVVAKIVRGEMTASQAKREYKITGGMTLQGWMTRYADEVKGRRRTLSTAPRGPGRPSIASIDPKQLRKQLELVTAERNQLEKRLRDIEAYFDKGYRLHFSRSN